MTNVAGFFNQIVLPINLYIYEGIKNLYNLMLYIAESQIVSNETISSFSSRIYVLLGIFMLFKLSFSLVTYVVNPDEFLDKTKGITSIGKNIIISLVLIVLTPYLFQESRELQNNILNEHVVENLVFGDTKISYTRMNSGGDLIQFSLFAQWIKPNPEIEELKDCNNLYLFEDDGTAKMDNGKYALNETDCMKPLKAKFESDKIKDSGAYFDYEDGLKNKNVAYFYNSRIFTAEEDGKFLVKYNSLFSMISGIIVIFILISFCFDIAVRSIKLAFFQIMAPIPIISLCDPKGKDGMFKKWGTSVVKTYLSLFVRLVALYFSISIINQILIDPKWHQIESITEGFATAFIIIGALMFAKQLPGILSEITGVKLNDKFTLNPFKRVEDDALGGKVATGAMGGAVAGFFGNINRRPISGLISGAFRGGLSNGGYRAGMQKQAEANRKMRDARIRGAGPIASRFAAISNRYGADDMFLENEAIQLRKDKYAVELARRSVDSQTKTQETLKKNIQQQIAPTEMVIAKQKAVKDASSAMESTLESYIEGNKAGQISSNYFRLKGQFEALKTMKNGEKLKEDLVYFGADGVTVETKYAKGTVITDEMRGQVENLITRYKKKEGKAALGDEAYSAQVTRDSDGAAISHSKYITGGNDLQALKNQQSTYSQAVEIANQAVTETNEKCGTTYETLAAEITYKGVHDQQQTIDDRVTAENNEITDRKYQIETIDNNIKDIVNEARVRIGKSEEEYSLEDAENDIKVREANIKDRQDQNKVNREMAQIREMMNKK